MTSRAAAPSASTSPARTGGSLQLEYSMQKVPGRTVKALVRVLSLTSRKPSVSIPSYDGSMSLSATVTAVDADTREGRPRSLRSRKKRPQRVVLHV